MAKVAPGRPGDRRAQLGSAFAICTSTLQKSGQLQPGTRTLTPRGAAKEGHARRKGNHDLLVAQFEDFVDPEGAKLDRMLVLAAAQAGVGGAVHLAPPLRGVPHNESPRIADLHTRPGASPGWDARKREVLAALRAGRAPVRRGRSGPYLALPRAAERVRTYANEVSGGTPSTQRAPWAKGVYTDPVFGTWGVAVDGQNVARLVLYRDGRFHEHGAVTWNPNRGRFEGAERLPPTHPRVLQGLQRAVLHAPGAAREALATAKLGGGAFEGSKPPQRPADPRAAALFDAVASGKCASAKVRTRRPGSKTRAEAEAAYQRASEIVLAVTEDVCGDAAEPVVSDSACDLALGAMESASVAPCALEPAKSCPHRVTAAQLAEWREGAMPPHGPYETPTAHSPGATPRCYYHPDTQRRLRVQQEALRRLHEAKPHATEVEELAAIERAERESPFYETWTRLDEDARKLDDVGADGAQAGGDAGMGLLRKFYTAAQRDDRGAALALYRTLASDLNLHDSFESFYALDRAFWDLAHRAAHDSDNLGYLTWTHAQMKARNLAIHHGRGGTRGHANPSRTLATYANPRDATTPTPRVLAVLRKAAESANGTIDVSLYINSYQEGADVAVVHGWLTPPPRGRRRIYTLTDAGRAVLDAQ